MKEDAPPPPHPPRKRYQLENQMKTPDHWLAVWANDPELSDEEREQVQTERERRRHLKPEKVLGVLVDREDVTPPQLSGLKDEMVKLRPTAVVHVWASRRVAGACRSAGVPVRHHQAMRQVILDSHMIIAAPRGPANTPCWEAVKFARHRKLPVTVVLPTGVVQ